MPFTINKATKIMIIIIIAIKLYIRL